MPAPLAVAAIASSAISGGAGIIGYRKNKKSINENYYANVQLIKEQIAFEIRQYQRNKAIQVTSNEIAIADVAYESGTGRGFTGNSGVVMDMIGYQTQQNAYEIQSIDDQFDATMLAYNNQLRNLEADKKTSTWNNTIGLISSVAGSIGDISQATNSIRQNNQAEKQIEEIKSLVAGNNNTKLPQVKVGGRARSSYGYVLSRRK